MSLLSSRDTIDPVKQSAALCLLRLYRTSPESLQLNNEWTARIIHLLNDQHLVRTTLDRSLRLRFFSAQGVATAAVSLIDALVKRNPDEYKGCINLAVSRLSRVRHSTDSRSDSEQHVTYVFRLSLPRTRTFKTTPITSFPHLGCA